MAFGMRGPLSRQVTWLTERLAWIDNPCKGALMDHTTTWSMSSQGLVQYLIGPYHLYCPSFRNTIYANCTHMISTDINWLLLIMKVHPYWKYNTTVPPTNNFLNIRAFSRIFRIFVNIRENSRFFFFLFFFPSPFSPLIYAWSCSIHVDLF